MTPPRQALWLLAFAAFAGVVPVRASQPTPEEIKARYLLHFAEFVEWPAGSMPGTNGHLVVGIVGHDPVIDLLRLQVGSRIAGRPLEIREFTSAQEFLQVTAPARQWEEARDRRATNVRELRSCHIVYVSASERSRVPGLVRCLQDSNILLVGDSAGFTRQGGVIGFFGTPVQIEISLAAVQKAGLRINPQLLRLAKVIAPEDAAPRSSP